ncbi:MAG: acyl-CoA dehydrogenase [Desulfobacula sp.]|jgi:acyl-CoA dehydrogenase|uniref:acyl-CoA dehydrogenase family protein n=1 Tax=Desulfobacula sp. TaxID=2593537 RepID=UPI001E158DF7|nr:acyl-CoA dehydrogenase [Desulfobacula sp.]MBT3806692.1 acyl-CoA dehydrogenase [Desulfobacula sp.]MBT4026958.1 acyl-CoA dehydrogenase [Desulfobacula sp.]MBT4197994.1 acyl-CoA dehydrogenase [Desulfobacula sp.]MBT4505786.1 acyl-CoA dehydrogenase [Desulfobacula sp.]
MTLFNPKTENFDHLDPKSKNIMKKTIDFFENRGKKKLKSDYHEKLWYEDFIEFIKENQIFATLLTPSNYAKKNPDARWDTRRICDFNEILGFYNLSHWYTWQVSILGLGPIWMSPNETIKNKTAKLLKDGHIFAFGLSEKTHGADLYSSDMSLTPLAKGQYVADGGKYYIGNANIAGIVSTFGKNTETDEYVFFAVNPEHENYDLVQNVVDWEGYVAEYALNGYPIVEDDILSTGQDAWDSALNTINIGKFNLGWASIGICTHAFYEGLNHAAGRNLYGKWVTDFPHIKQMFVDAYSRLVAMKLFSQRASDYFRSASKDDRRYLLYNPMVKMKVPSQGETVINLLWDVIAARGFEKDAYFEMAATDIRALPKLEGTIHINMALIIKFMANFFFNPGEFPEIGKRDDAVCDEFLFNQGLTKGLGKIQFHDFNIAYGSIDLPNINIFKEQINVLQEMLLKATPDKNQAKNMDFLLYLGEMFTLVAYGQLIIEKFNMDQFEEDLLEQIFDFMIRDFSEYALKLYSKTDTKKIQMDYCQKMIKKPVTDIERFSRIWENHVISLKDSYEMNP